MDKINDILNRLRNGVPQALGRFNDGEVRGIIKVGDTVARGCQKVNQELSEKLTEALRHEQENYWKGLPCEVCFPRFHKRAMFYVDPNYKYLTKAVVNTNRNLKRVWRDFPKFLDGKIVYWVSGGDQDLGKLREETGIDVFQKLTLPKRNAWREYEHIKDRYRVFQKGAVVILSCGPMAEVLVKEWFEQRPDVSFFDMGSTFDPFTRNVWHRCHRGTLPKCKGCN